MNFIANSVSLPPSPRSSCSGLRSTARGAGRHRSGPHTGPEVLHRPLRLPHRQDLTTTHYRGRGASPTCSSRASAVHPTDRPIRLSAGSSRRVARVMPAALLVRLAQPFGADVPDELLPGVGALCRGQGALAGVGCSAARPTMARNSSVNGGPQLRYGAVDGVVAGRLCLCERSGATGPNRQADREAEAPLRRNRANDHQRHDTRRIETGALGYETIRHVRVMHAAVRHLLLHGEDPSDRRPDPIGAWDDATWASP